MKKHIIIAVSLLTITLHSCTKPSSSSTPSSSSGDTTFNGSYVQLTINSTYFMEKDALVNGDHLVTLTSVVQNMTDTAGNIHSALLIYVADVLGIYGLKTGTILCSWGTGTGTYQLESIGGAYGIVQNNPLETYMPVSGTETITHNGTDYIQGTVSGTFDNNAGSPVPVTGSFKINH